jgi:hypothetical protein
MARKIFISYKYGDRDVYPLTSGGLFGTTVRHYVDELQTHLDLNDHINKGENDNESLAGFKDETIASRLRDKIFDSSITIVLISKNMVDPSMREDDQWIPWEISYSLKEMTKGDRTSGTNAVVAVVLPDKAGSYDYFVKSVCSSGCLNWKNETAFGIIGKNMFNRTQPKTINCVNHPNSGAVHTGHDHSYIYPVRWRDFIFSINFYLDIATQINENVNDYNLVKIP